MSEYGDEDSISVQWVNPYAGLDCHQVQVEARDRYPLDSILTFTDTGIIDKTQVLTLLATGAINGDPICAPEKGVFIPVFVRTDDGLGKTVYVAEPNILDMSKPKRSAT